MRTIIFYYTGTGNSLWTARCLAEGLGEATVLAMSAMQSDVIHVDAECIGLVFPVHMWGVPHRVIDFVNRLNADTGKYYFAVAVNAGQVSATLLQLKKIMYARGIPLNSGFSLVCPSNYIPWGGPGTSESIWHKINKAFLTLRNHVIPKLRTQISNYLEEGPGWQKIIFSWIYRVTFSKIAIMDKSFRVDATCTRCKQCVRICPARNIEMGESYPVWKHRCEQCLACLQWCPQQAIQYGENTRKYARYHHPAVQLKDMPRHP